MRLYMTSARPRVFPLILCILLICLATSCRNVVENGLTEMATSFPFNLMLQEQDLPPGWSWAGGTAPDVPDANSRVGSFRVSNDPKDINLLVTDQLTVYPNETAAQQAYASWERDWFLETYGRPPDAQFVPRDSHDQFRLGCLWRIENTQTVGPCTYLQQHKQFISLVTANLDGQRFTLSQFETALQRRDARLSSR